MNYDPIEVVIDMTVRRFNLRDWSYDIDALAEDIAEGLKLIGAAKVYMEKTANLTVMSKMAKLPRDCENVKYLNPIHKFFKESNSCLIINAADGTQIELVYQAMPTDTRGLPLVPDNAAVRAALMWYLASILILQGEISKISYSYAESEWQWRCGSARADLSNFNIHQMNTIHTNFTRLDPIKDAHQNDYMELDSPDTLDREKNRITNRP